jgi:hypothetical protein
MFCVVQIGSELIIDSPDEFWFEGMSIVSSDSFCTEIAAFPPEDVFAIGRLRCRSDHADGFDSALIVVWKTARHSPFVIRQMVAQL